MIFHYTLAVFAVFALCQAAEVPELDGRIVGGHEAKIEDFPYQVSLQSYGSHICGGSIVTADCVVTAAHCVYRTSPQVLSCRTGSTIRGSGGSIHSVSRVVWHENYNPSTLDFDYAFVKVSKMFQWSASVQPIGLAEREVSSGTNAVVTGWGTLTSGGSLPSKLQQVVVPIVDHQTCQNNYYPYVITARMTCAGVPKGGKDACQGDSGGPLVTNGGLYGIVSWGLGCGAPKIPGVYSKVANQRDWFKRNIGL